MSYPPAGYGYGYPQAGVVATPGTITAARILGWIEFAGTTLGAIVLLILGAALSSARSNNDEDFGSLANLAGGVLIGISVVLVALAVGLAVLLVKLKPGRSAPPIVLCVFRGFSAPFGWSP